MPEGRNQTLFALKKGLKFILASSSPRRQHFFASLGMTFEVWKPTQEPKAVNDCTPAKYVQQAAKAKALECRDAIGKPCLIIGADTIVVLASNILGKPKCHEEAFAMLKAQNGKTSRVISAACLILPDGEICEILDESEVKFHHWPDNVLKSYAQSSEPMDKAGAFAIQGNGAFLIDCIIGSYTTVLGIPGAQIIQTLLEKRIIYPCL